MATNVTRNDYNHRSGYSQNRIDPQQLDYSEQADAENQPAYEVEEDEEEEALKEPTIPNHATKAAPANPTLVSSAGANTAAGGSNSKAIPKIGARAYSPIGQAKPSKPTSQADDQTAEPVAALDQVDLEELLEQHFPKRGSWWERGPEEAFPNARRWIGATASLAVRPFNWFLDDAVISATEAGEQAEPMSFLKINLYRFGGLVIFLFSAYLTQVITANLFPDPTQLDKAATSLTTTATGQRDGFFASGLFTISARAVIASLVFTLMLSIIETMLFDTNKSRAKKIVIVVAFGVDIVINTIGWANFLGHSKKLEWNPLIPLLLRHQEVEWGSFVCEFAAVLNACLPEWMWEKAKRGARARKLDKLRYGASSKHSLTSAGKDLSHQQNGVWLRTASGANKFFTEAELRELAKKRAKSPRSR